MVLTCRDKREAAVKNVRKLPRSMNWINKAMGGEYILQR